MTTQLGNWLSTPNDPELHRQIAREIRRRGRSPRCAMGAAARLAVARELVYIERRLFAATAQACEKLTATLRLRPS